jgi:RNAse (barnase) inhibitor barstar
MATAILDTSRIIDWDTFHAVSREAFGFPDFYGCNLNAWIDCLTYLDEGD